MSDRKDGIARVTRRRLLTAGAVIPIASAAVAAGGATPKEKEGR